MEMEVEVEVDVEDPYDDKTNLISKSRMVRRDPSDPKFETKDNKFVIDT
jgi:hypothetical protein